MLRQRGSRLHLVFIVILISGAVGKLPPGTPWASFAGKSPVYSRSLGPPAMSGVGTMSIPYVPKASFFPKFVDPRVMISKKTDLLSNLFGGIGPVDFGPNSITRTSVPSYGPGVSTLSTLSAAERDPTGTKAEESFENSLNAVLGGASDYKRSESFGPPGPKFPLGGTGYQSAQGFFDEAVSSRRKRSTVAPNPLTSLATPDDATSKKTNFLDDLFKNTGLVPPSGDTNNAGPPPPYPGLGPIPEEAESIEETRSLEKTSDFTGPVAPQTVPREYLPGMYGPFGPTMDPSMFMAKKSAFLDTLFKTIATTTPPTTTDIPVPKSTIVPPSFWFPTTSVIQDPSVYDDKVSEFLDKLFDTLKLNKTVANGGSTNSDVSSSSKSEYSRSLKTDSVPVKVARSLDNLAAIITAKDSIVDSILSELGDLKGDMVMTLNDLIAYQKTAAPPFPPIGTKPFKTFPPGLWTKSTVDSTLPYKQRMIGLSQVFDMLTELQRNVTTVIREAIKSNAIDSSDTSAVQGSVNYPAVSINDGQPIGVNLTLLDAIKNKLASIDSTSLSGESSQKKMSRTLPKDPKSVWVAYPQSTSSTGKRQVEDVPQELAQLYNEDRLGRERYTKGIEMQMHQGYQSLPPGAVESVQAGGGSVTGHEGGGIKLLDAKGYQNVDNWKDWGELLRKSYQRHRHHHDHR